MAKSNWAYEFLLDSLKEFAKSPASSLTNDDEFLKELEEAQLKELKILKKCIKSGQLPPLLNDIKQGLEESKASISKTIGHSPSQNTTNSTTNLTIKLEKVSLVPPQEDTEKENIKNEDMPAPKWVPPVKKKTIKTERLSSTRSTRSTRTKSKQQSTIRDSDVIFQNLPVPVVNLTEEDLEECVTRATRSTRTKTKKDVEAVKEGAETTRTTRTKKRAARKDVMEESESAAAVAEVAETRSTRTKKKSKPVDEEPEPEIRSTRTKTIRKAKNVADVDVGSNREASDVEVVCSTRSKAVKKINDPNTTVTVFVDKESERRIKKDEVENKSKRSRPISDDDTEGDQDKKTKKSNSNSSHTIDNSASQTEFEDARSTMDDGSIAPQQETTAANSTFVLMKNVMPQTEENIKEEQRHHFGNNVECDLFTDDESTNEVKTPPPAKGIATIHKSTKEVFSPYEKTTLKKKVEAFEKLQTGTENSLKKGGSKLPSLINSAVKEKTKLFTPLGSSKVPIASSISTSKIHRFFPQQSRDSSHTKSSQKDPREYARKQQEREQAQQKKEALLMCQTETLRKRNDEKKLKAEQARKARDEEKAKLKEMLKLKEDKLKQREEIQKRFQQEQEIKKRQEEMKRLEAVKRAKDSKPIYMTTRLPMLGSDDYDSDDPNYRNIEYPSWCADKASKTLQICMIASGQKIKNTLFCIKPETPNLVEIFEVIDERKLKRTSSAIWRKPPRYTMMPDDVLNETKFSDDDDV